MPSLNLNGVETTAAIDKAAKAETEVNVQATEADGGTVRAELNSSGSYWSAAAWYQWAKDKGRGYGAKVGFKF